MDTFRFHTVIGNDRIIRVPPEIAVGVREAEVILVPKNPLQEDTSKPTDSSKSVSLAERLSRLAGQLGVTGLPSDLAQNHDHYAHGAPKGIDES